MRLVAWHHRIVLAATLLPPLSAASIAEASAALCDASYAEVTCVADGYCGVGRMHCLNTNMCCSNGSVCGQLGGNANLCVDSCAECAVGDYYTSNCVTGVATEEICGNGLDDDYDGCVDNGCPLGEGACTCTAQCNPKPTSCPPQTSRPKATCNPYNSSSETCFNREDDNCNGLVDEGCAPCKGDGCCLNKAGTDPILLSSQSAVTEAFSDFSVDTGLGQIGITRTYSSADWSYSGGPAGVFGRGWHHDWEGGLSCSGSTCTVAVGLDPGFKFQPSGSALSLDGTETWQIYVPWSNAVMVGDNQNILVRRPSGEWIMFSTDGRELHFDMACDTCTNPATDPVCLDAAAGGRARMTKVVDARGDAVHISYNRVGGVLLSLSDDLGHVLQMQSASACVDGLASSLTYDGMLVTSYVYSGPDLVQATDADGLVLRSYAYDTLGTGRLLAVNNESGNAVAQFAYDATGRATGVVDKVSSASVTYGVPGGVQVTEFFGNTSAASVRALNQDGNATSISDGCACGPARSFVWTNHRLTCVVDAQNHVTWQDFDAQGRLTHVAEYSSAQGCSVAPGTLGTNSREEWRDYGVVKPIAQGVSLALDRVVTVSRKTAYQQMKHAVETFSYDPVAQSIDPAGYACQQTPLPAGSVVCRHVDTNYTHIPTGIGTERHATFFSYDARGRLVRTLGPINLDYPSASDVTPIEERSYWSDAETLPRRGRLQQLKRYASSTSTPLVTAYDYDAFGIFQVTEPAGGLTTIVKDGRGRPISVLAPDGAQRQTRYYDGLDPRIQLWPSGGAVRFGYDLLGRLASMEYLSSDPDVPGATPVLAWGEYFTYDVAGNRTHTERRDGSGAVSWQQDREYDVQHRVVRDTNPESPATARTLSYDPSGFMNVVTDEEGRITRFTPDELNRVKKVTRTDTAASATLDVAQYTYRLYGDPLAQAVDGAARNTNYEYDDFGRLMSLATSNANTMTYAYDARGNLLQRGGPYTVTSTYDGLDRLLTVNATAFQSTITYTYRYDEAPYAGRLTSVVEGDRTIRFGYDATGRVTTEAIQENGVASALVTRYVYGPDGLVAEIYSPSGLHLQLVRDPATREVTQVNGLPAGPRYADAVTHYPGGPPKALSLGNGLAVSQSFNRRYEPTAVSSGPLSIGYGMSPAGDVGSTTEGATTRTFQYDFLDRFWNAPSWLTYGYDNNGNRLSETVDGQAASYTYNFDRVARHLVPSGTTQVAWHGFAYDSRGNITGVAVFDSTGTSVTSAICLRNDALGRVTLVGWARGLILAPAQFNGTNSVCVQDLDVATPTARVKYDFRNRRIARWLASTNQWTYIISDSAGNPLSEVALSGGTWVPVRDYVWLDGRPVAQVEYAAPSHTYYYHLDHVGLPRALTNEAGQTVWSAAPRPYGDVVETTTTDPLSGRVVVTNLRLPGQYDERLLGGIGLQGPYYNWHRWYLPSIGRYLELDPPTLQGLLDVRGKVLGPAPEWYAYARGNPLRYTDPKGLYGTKCCTFYERRCAQSGGTSTYFCTLANSVCNRVEKGDPWSDCVRKCLQDMDRAKRNDSDKDQVCKPLPYSGGDFTADHALCFAQCKVDTNSNPFNNTSEPNDDNCEH